MAKKPPERPGVESAEKLFGLLFTFVVNFSSDSRVADPPLEGSDWFFKKNAAGFLCTQRYLFTGAYGREVSASFVLRPCCLSPDHRIFF